MEITISDMPHDGCRKTVPLNVGLRLDYALGKRWSLRAESGTTSGAGLFYRFAWD